MNELVTKNAKSVIENASNVLSLKEIAIIAQCNGAIYDALQNLSLSKMPSSQVNKLITAIATLNQLGQYYAIEAKEVEFFKAIYAKWDTLNGRTFSQNGNIPYVSILGDVNAGIRRIDGKRFNIAESESKAKANKAIETTENEK